MTTFFQLDTSMFFALQISVCLMFGDFPVQSKTKKRNKALTTRSQPNLIFRRGEERVSASEKKPHRSLILRTFLNNILLDKSLF